MDQLLPPELLSRILSHLPPSEISRAALISRAFADVVADEGTWREALVRRWELQRMPLAKRLKPESWRGEVLARSAAISRFTRTSHARPPTSYALGFPAPATGAFPSGSTSLCPLRLRLPSSSPNNGAEEPGGREELFILACKLDESSNPNAILSHPGSGHVFPTSRFRLVDFAPPRLYLSTFLSSSADDQLAQARERRQLALEPGLGDEGGAMHFTSFSDGEGAAVWSLWAMDDGSLRVSRVEVTVKSAAAPAAPEKEKHRGGGMAVLSGGATLAPAHGQQQRPRPRLQAQVHKPTVSTALYDPFLPPLAASPLPAAPEQGGGARGLDVSPCRRWAATVVGKERVILWRLLLRDREPPMVGEGGAEPSRGLNEARPQAEQAAHWSFARPAFARRAGGRPEDSTDAVLVLSRVPTLLGGGNEQMGRTVVLAGWEDGVVGVWAHDEAAEGHRQVAELYLHPSSSSSSSTRSSTAAARAKGSVKFLALDLPPLIPSSSSDGYAFSILVHRTGEASFERVDLLLSLSSSALSAVRTSLFGVEGGAALTAVVPIFSFDEPLTGESASPASGEGQRLGGKMDWHGLKGGFGAGKYVAVGDDDGGVYSFSWPDCSPSIAQERQHQELEGPYQVLRHPGTMDGEGHQPEGVSALSAERGAFWYAATTQGKVWVLDPLVAASPINADAYDNHAQREGATITTFFDPSLSRSARNMPRDAADRSRDGAQVIATDTGAVILREGEGTAWVLETLERGARWTWEVDARGKNRAGRGDRRGSTESPAQLSERIRDGLGALDDQTADTAEQSRLAQVYAMQGLSEEDMIRLAMMMSAEEAQRGQEQREELELEFGDFHLEEDHASTAEFETDDEDDEEQYAQPYRRASFQREPSLSNSLSVPTSPFLSPAHASPRSLSSSSNAWRIASSPSRSSPGTNAGGQWYASSSLNNSKLQISPRLGPVHAPTRSLAEVPDLNDETNFPSASASSSQPHTPSRASFSISPAPARRGWSDVARPNASPSPPPPSSLASHLQQQQQRSSPWSTPATARSREQREEEELDFALRLSAAEEESRNATTATGW